jgi:WD40 repeat protein
MLIPFDAPERFTPKISFSPGGRRVVVSSENAGWAAVLDLAAGKQIERYQGEGSNAHPQFLSDARLLLQTDKGLAAIDVATGREVWSEPELVGWGVWVSSRRNRVVVGPRLYDLKTRKHLRSFGPVVLGRSLGAAFSPDGGLFALDMFSEGDFHKQRLVQLWEVRREPLYRLLEVEVRGDGDQGVMAFSPDGRLLAVSLEGEATLFDVKKGKRVGGVGGPVVATDMRFSPSGRNLMVVSYDGEVYRSAVKSGRLREHLPAPDGPELEACAVNDRGLAAGVAGAAVLLWQLPEWEDAEPGCT